MFELAQPRDPDLGSDDEPVASLRRLRVADSDDEPLATLFREAAAEQQASDDEHEGPWMAHLHKCHEDDCRAPNLRIGGNFFDLVSYIFAAGG